MSCDPSKAPGFDGFNLNFIPKMWDIVGSDFKKTIMNFFVNRAMDQAMNMTWVTLIPKFEGVKEVKDFKSISMVGVCVQSDCKGPCKKTSSGDEWFGRRSPNSLYTRQENFRWCVNACKYVH